MFEGSLSITAGNAFCPQSFNLGVLCRVQRIAYVLTSPRTHLSTRLWTFPVKTLTIVPRRLVLNTQSLTNRGGPTNKPWSLPNLEKKLRQESCEFLLVWG